MIQPVRVRGNRVLRKALAIDAQGRVTQSQHGNGAVHTRAYRAQTGRIQVHFYDGDRRRLVRVDPAVKTVYVTPRAAPGAYERDTLPSGAVRHVHHLSAGCRSVGTYLQSGTQTALRYFHADHLGSVRSITDAGGVEAERFTFDAYGKRQPASGATIKPDLTQLSGAARAGFTGHEHLDPLNLVHMGGRVYDPQLGRFLSPDPQVQYPHDGQGTNRYSDVQNNPLSRTDPTGYGFRKEVFDDLRGLDSARRVVIKGLMLV